MIAEQITPSHISLIENPSLGPDPIVVEGIISSTSLCYLTPETVVFNWTDRDGLLHEDEYYILPNSEDNLKFAGVGERGKISALCRLAGVPTNARVTVVKHRAVYKLRVRPRVFTLEARENKIVDEEGREYKPYDVYVVTDKPIFFQPSSRVILVGKALPDPKSQKATMLATKVVFPDAVEGFDPNTLAQLREKLRGKTVAERVDWILDNFEKYSHVVGRRNLAYTALLGYFTPLWINFNGDRQRGWGLVLIAGDTTTGKSETIRKLIRLLGAGTLITAETASAVGLTGTATQVEGGEWFTDWGFLVLNDRGLLAIDGAHKLSSSAWATLAEAERTGVVVKATAAKGSAPARTRQIKIANAVDQEKGRYSTKSVSSFLYPIQCIATILDKTSLARLDLVAISDQRTVPPEMVNQLRPEAYDPDLEKLSEAVKWCWSGHAEVQFTEEAIIYLLDQATRLYEDFHCASIPIVDVNQKWKLARLSAALAFLTLSANEDFSVVTVTPEHVEEVVALIRYQYTEAGLNALAKHEEYDVITKEEAADLLVRMTASSNIDLHKAVAIAKWIPIQGGFTRDQLKEAFSLAEKSQLRNLTAALQNMGLVKNSGRGFTPEPKLVQLYKLLEESEEEVLGLVKPEYVEPRGPPQLTDYKEASDEAGDTVESEGGGLKSGGGRLGSFGGPGPKPGPATNSAKAAQPGKETPPSSEDGEEEKLKNYILKHTNEEGVGYLRVKVMMEKDLGVKLTVPQFEHLVMSLDRDGLVEFNGITIRRLA